MHIALDNISFGYAAETLFEDLSVRLSLSETGRGNAYAILGRSGSGKTTILHLLAALISPSRGRVDRDAVTDLDIGLLSQRPVLLPHLSIRDNARLLSRIAATRDRFDEAHFRNLTERLGIAHLLEHGRPISAMSGGEAQRIALLRAMSVRPRVLLLDEPCSGLDAALRYQFVADLRDLVLTSSIIVAYVTHHMDEAELLADQYIYVDRERGRPATVASGDRDRLLSAPESIDAVSILLGEPINVLPATGTGERITIQLGSERLMLRSSTPVEGDISLAVPASSVLPEGTPEFASRALRVTRLAAHDRLLVAAGDIIDVRGLVVRGAAYVFRAGDRAGRRISISPWSAS